MPRRAAFTFRARARLKRPGWRPGHAGDRLGHGRESAPVAARGDSAENRGAKSHGLFGCGDP